ncbi:hypothetical protein [Salinibius halmophilus]|uniref:hypothetical protein n=1 Tax=Salinibius halmophilus TaxID=1853216 RepID=UPI000E66B53C|nr:hypothetical protein [Salinibius halmophilus]
MKHILTGAVLLLAGCATMPELPEQQPFELSVEAPLAELTGVLYTRESDETQRKLLALVEVYTTINEALVRCDFASATLSVDSIGPDAYQVNYQCEQAVSIEPTAEVAELASTCTLPSEAQPILTEWRGRKLPLMAYQGGFSVSSVPPMSPELAQNWAEQTILANALAEGYECKALVIDPVSPECAHYGFAVRCSN